MEQYIPKYALVAEIERRLETIAYALTENNKELSALRGAQQYELINLIQYIDTLEVKEVDEEPYVMSDKGKFTTTTKSTERRIV